MEGLIKGLINIALGNDRNEEEPQEQQSRSTWAEVVSGNQEEHEEQAFHGHHQQNVWGKDEEDGNDRRQNPWAKQGESASNNEDWQTVSEHHRKPSRQPYKGKDDEHDNDQRRNPWARQEESASNNVDWQTVSEHHRKPSRQPHKVLKDHYNNYKRPPSEQDYADEVGDSVNAEPSEQELANLSEACSRLWELDLNRLVPGKDYEIDCGEGKKPYQKEDRAEGSLFSWVSDDIFKRPTYARFLSLLDNYNPNEGCKEVVTSEEKQEQAAFIEEISRTAPIKYLHKYLVSKGLVTRNSEDFKRMMIHLWFDLYNRGGTSNCSSAFEHVFVGEIKNRGENEVSGFHNWIQFYVEEAKGRIDYQGYILPRRHGQFPDSETQLLTIQFEWNGILKSLSTTLVGVSPEFEMALYTLCFFMGGEDNHIQLGPYPVNIKCYRLGDDKIGSVFPIALD